jgi:hypothetical protein
MAIIQPKIYVSIARNPFARQETIRCTEDTHQDCSWCGSNRPSGRLFRYGTETDGGTVHWQDKLFCGVDCMRCYYY